MRCRLCKTPYGHRISFVSFWFILAKKNSHVLMYTTNFFRLRLNTKINQN